MPINTNLSTAPYFDDYNIQDQYYRILFKPGYAVQARELTQLQTILQNQVEQFGDNIFKEGSIVKGCNFSTINNLKYVKIVDDITTVANDYVTSGVVTDYISRRVTMTIGGVEDVFNWTFELEGGTNGLKAVIVSADRGYEDNAPDLNTFYVTYTNADAVGGIKQFVSGETLTINLIISKVGDTSPDAGDPGAEILTISNIGSTSVSTLSPTGNSFGIQSTPGVIFQKGHFLFADEQTLIISKYSQSPDQVNVGYRVEERKISALQDNSLYDNANGSSNFNAPGADRLKLTPVLTVLPAADADADPSFFSLIRYEGGNAVTIRDVSQYNVIGDALAKRTFEESGNYVVRNFNAKTERRNDVLKAVIGNGVAYVRGFRVENSAERIFTIDEISDTDTQQNQPVSFNYGSYVDVVSFNGRFSLDYSRVNLLDETDSVIGTTIVSNVSQNKLHLFGTKMDADQRFRDVVKIDGPVGEVVVANTAPAVMKDNLNAPLIFDTGMFSLKETTNMIIPVRVTSAVTISGTNTITITAGADENFTVDNDDVVVITDASEYLEVVDVSTASADSELTVELASGAGSAALIYYNKNLVGNKALPHGKTIVEPFIKLVFDTTQDRYSLGFPDVYSIVSITDASGTDFTTSFRLRENQKDHYYDISFMEYISGRPKPANGVLTIQLKVFEINSSTGNYFFTVNSYNASTPSNPNTGLEANEISVYTASNGRSYNLRDCIDFRPHVDPDSAADYGALTAGAAPTISTAVGANPITFASLTPLVPAKKETGTLDIEYYLSRVDLVTVDSFGKFSLIKGDEERFPKPQRVGNDKLVVSEITIPGYPALSSQEAANQRRKQYGVKTKFKGTKNYTMKDISDIEKKVDALVYYISLSQLESETQNLTILDENGLSRFKNGFIVDPFNDLTFSEINDPKFNAAIAFNRKILMPSVKTFPLDLTYSSSTNATPFPPSNPRVVSLNRNLNVELIKQPYATNIRNCVSNFYNYRGIGELSPPYDAAYDFTVNPDPVEIDLVTPFQDFADALQNFLPLTDTLIGDSAETQAQRAERSGSFTETFATLEIGEDASRSFVGDFVTNLEFRPFMAPRDIKIFMTGLKPNTQHYFFFDGVNVDSFVTPGISADEAVDVERNGEQGDAVVTDASGTLTAVFSLPAETFYVGDRVLKVVDVDQYSSIDSASTSRGTLTYRAYNFSIERTSLSTRVPEFDVSTVEVSRNVTWRSDIGGEGVSEDPLAQTFFIKNGMGKGSNTVFLSQIDVFFKRKSLTNGVTLMLREVINGYPSSKNIAFGKVHLKPSDVVVSDDSSAATTFVFPAPVRLETETEYAIVIQPDGNDSEYLVFTSRPGGGQGDDLGQEAGIDFLTQERVTQDWGDGVLFTSTNNRAWKSEQNEDLKFTVYRHNFNQSSGSVTLVNNGSEFFTVDDITGPFNIDELIYQELDTPTTGISVTDNVVTGTGFTSYAAGEDYVLIKNAGASRSDIFLVTAVNSATEMLIDRTPSFSVSGGTATPIVKGNLSYYDKRNPSVMYLDRSSTTTTKTFSTATDIIGFDSGSSANLVSIDNVSISFVQPMIARCNDSVTTTKMTGRFTNPNDVNTPYTRPMSFSDNNYFGENGCLIYSKSNDPSGTKPFELTIDMTNGTNVTSSPLVDVELSKFIAYQYNITNDPETTSTYVSKIVELAEAFDADDFNLIITGYRPVNTEIKCYIKPQNVFDSESFGNLDWLELELFEGVGVFSSTVNTNDYREYRYRVPEKPDANTAGLDSEGVLEYTSESGTFNGFRRFAVRIDLLSTNNYNAPTLKDYRGIALT